jgi:hypothetical protein
MKKRNRGNNYDWTAIQTEYDSGFSIRFLAKKYGMATRSFTLAMKRGDLTTRDRSSAIKKSYEVNGPRKWSTEAKERHSETMSHKMANRKVASKRFVHNGVILESSWEKKVAVSLDEASVVWVRPAPVLYNDDGQVRRYYPDFYLPDYDCYLDPKNSFVAKRDERKLSLVREQSKINLIVLDEHQLSWAVIQQLI